jgi:hypothetical protein
MCNGHKEMLQPPKRTCSWSWQLAWQPVPSDLLCGVALAAWTAACMLSKKSVLGGSKPHDLSRGNRGTRSTYVRLDLRMRNICSSCSILHIAYNLPLIQAVSNAETHSTSKPAGPISWRLQLYSPVAASVPVHGFHLVTQLSAAREAALAGSLVLCTAPTTWQLRA